MFNYGYDEERERRRSRRDRETEKLFPANRRFENNIK
jgi:hypothetical protein